MLELMKQNKEEFKTIFVKNDLLTWSVDGCSRRTLEINTMTGFVDATESVFYEGTF